MNLQTVLHAIQGSGAEAAVAIRDEWDQGWQVRMDEALEPLAADLDEAADWLHEKMLQRYPLSKYAKNLNILKRFPPRGKQRGDRLGAALARLYNSVDRVGISSAPGGGWDVRFNQTFERVPTLEAAIKWLKQQEPTELKDEEPTE
jgi:hypothetical protein